MKFATMAMEKARCICGCAPSRVESTNDNPNIRVVFHCGAIVGFFSHEKPILFP